jgi:hypothetical protein
MSALHSAVLKTFKDQGWECRAVPGQEVVESWFEAHHGKVFLHAQSFGDAGMITVVSNASISVPISHLRTVAELLMRTNKELNLGNHELDWDGGQVMFRVSNVFPVHRPDERILASLIHTAVAEMDRLTPYLAEVCRLGTGELLLANIPEILAREDLTTVPDVAPGA